MPLERSGRGLQEEARVLALGFRSRPAPRLGARMVWMQRSVPSKSPGGQDRHRTVRCLSWPPVDSLADGAWLLRVQWSIYIEQAVRDREIIGRSWITTLIPSDSFSSALLCCNIITVGTFTASRKKLGWRRWILRYPPTKLKICGAHARARSH